MKKLSILILSIFFASFSCQEKAEEPTFEVCGVKDPVKELAWLAERIASSGQSELNKYFYITVAEYNEETIFLMKNCCPFCNSVVTAYNCEGTFLGVVGPESEIDGSQLSNERVIWKPVNSSCSI